MVITHHLLSQIDETYDMQFENVELIFEEFKYTTYEQFMIYTPSELIYQYDEVKI